MATLQGVCFLILSVALFLVDYRAWKTGTIKFGRPERGSSKLPSDYEAKKLSQPVLFWFVFIFYAGIGIWLVIFSLRLFTGNADPLSFGI